MIKVNEDTRQLGIFPVIVIVIKKAAKINLKVGLCRVDDDWRLPLRPMGWLMDGWVDKYGSHPLKCDSR